MFVSHTAIAILSAFFAAIGTILARPLLKQIKSKEILGINFLTMTTVLLLLSPLFYFFKVTYLSVGLLMLVSLIDTVANYFYFKTFEQTDASAASPILSISPAFTFFSQFFTGRIITVKYRHSRFFKAFNKFSSLFQYLRRSNQGLCGGI